MWETVAQRCTLLCNLHVQGRGLSVTRMLLLEQDLRLGICNARQAAQSVGREGAAGLQSLTSAAVSASGRIGRPMRRARSAGLINLPTTAGRESLVGPRRFDLTIG